MSVRRLGHYREPRRLAAMPKRNASVICRTDHSPVGFLVTSIHRSCRRSCPSARKVNNGSKVILGTVHTSISAITSTLSRGNVFLPREGDCRPRVIYRESLVRATAKPNVNNSAWICDALRSGLSRLIHRIISRKLRSFLGRPARFRNFQPLLLTGRRQATAFRHQSGANADIVAFEWSEAALRKSPPRQRIAMERSSRAAECRPRPRSKLNISADSS